MVICLERGADLHMAQLMPLPLTVSCFSRIQIGFTFLVPAYPGSPGQRAVKRVRVCYVSNIGKGLHISTVSIWINSSWKFSCVACVCSLGLPESQCKWSMSVSGFISRAAEFIHNWQWTVLSSCGYWGQNVNLPLRPIEQITIHAVEGRGSPHIYRNL